MTRVEAGGTARSARPSRVGIAAGVLLAAAGFAVAAALNPRPLLLLNTTSSEPIGLYVASAAPLRIGALMAFRAPAAAFPYADGRLAYLRHRPLLKTLAAGAGDHVCTAAGRLTINGRDRGAVRTADHQGGSPPLWRDCRRLRAGEAFAVSDRVPNSFDSRYFGPVSIRAIVGVYRPLLVIETGR